MKTKILSPLRRDGYKAGMIMMLIALSTMLLTTACSSDDDLVNNTANTENTINKGYALPVTVNVTRQGDATTRASFDGSKLNFGAGDKLFVSGYYGGSDDKQFAGMLEYDAVSGKFSGTIYTEDNTYSTYEDLFGNSDFTIATLLPAGYESYGYLSISNNNTDALYDDYVEESHVYTLATSKADGVAQFSYEQASTYSSGFALSPNNAILNFTVTGFAANTNVAVSLTGDDYNITKTVTTDNSGNAKFAVGIRGNYDLNNFTLTVGGNPITLVSSSKKLAAGKIYNIARNVIPGALIGVFSVGDTKKVYFSKGNLQATYDGDAWTWAFAANQWDYIGGRSYGGSETQTGNNFINGNGTVSPNGTVDLFGWSTSATYLGIHNSNDDGDYSGGFFNWGSHEDVTAGIGEGWCTLTKAEWSYLFYSRSDAPEKYGYATVNGVHGIIFLPDAFVDPNKNNGSDAFVGSTTDWNDNLYTAENWALMEKNGAVFLPAAGYRDWGTDVNVTDVEVAGDRGYYWSSTADGDAHYVYFDSGDLVVDEYTTSRYIGHSVRLVRPVQ